MTTINATVSFAKQRPILTGVLAVLTALIIGVCIAFVVGLTNPTATHADGLDGGDDSGIDIGDSGATDIGTGIDTGIDTSDTGDTGIDTGSDTGIDITDQSPTDIGSGDSDTGIDIGDSGATDIGAGDPTGPDLGQAPDTSTTESPTDSDTDLEPCCTDSTPALTTDLGQAPDKSTAESSVDTDTDLEPCCTVTETPPEETPPVVTPPVVVPPVVIPPVTPPVKPPTAPSCTLVASPHSIAEGSSSTLSWTTSHATSFTIDEHIGSVVVPSGSTSVSPEVTTTYTGTATGSGGTVNCSTTIVVTNTPPPPPPPPPSAPACTLSATPTTINQGGYATLNWTTTNATSFTIDQHLGSETPVGAGSTQVSPSVTTTYTGTATGSGGTVHCSTTVIVVTTPPPPPGSPECTLSANPTTINQGGSSTLSWTSTNVNSVSINEGIGNEGTSGSTSVSPNTTTTYVGTFTGSDNQTVTCQTTVIVQPPPPSCTANCGGGGGGQYVFFQGSSIPQPQPVVAAAYVSLSQIPYTGLDLGPVGTVVYWVTLILICLAAAYLIIFNLLPFLYHRLQAFGLDVSRMLNQPSGLALVSGAGIATSYAVSAQRSPAPVAMATPAPAYKSAYSINQGFRSFAEGNTLTIDDIVKGLAREAGVAAPVAAMAPTMTSQDLIASHAQETRPQTAVMYSSAQPARATESSAPVSTDVRDFVAALLNGDRQTVFSSYRQIIREGGDGEAFITQVVCALDDAYRARVENTPVHPEIAQLTATCATPFLEHLTSALTNAVDSSYSPGVTGGKLALTRALAVVEG